MALPHVDLNIGPGVGKNHVSVQVPTGSDGAIDVYNQSEIAAGLEVATLFQTVTSPIAGTLFAARADGPKTSAGASGARCELRMSNIDGTDIAFQPFDGNEYIIELTSVIVDHPTSGADIDGIGVVLMQLHNGANDRLTVRTQYVSGTMRLRHRVNGTAVTGSVGGSIEVAGGTANATGTNIWNASGTIEWPLKIRLHSGNGSTCTHELYVNGALWHTGTALNTTGATGEGWYLKAGVYNNFDETNVSSTAFGKVIVKPRTFKIWRTGWPAVFYGVPELKSAGSLTASATATVTPTIPTPAAGDYVTVQAYSYAGSAPVAPSGQGWAQLADVTETARMGVFGKVWGVAGNTDDTTPDFTGGGTSGYYAQAAVWTGVDPTTPSDVAAATNSSGATGTTTLTAPTIDVATDHALAVYFGGQMDNYTLADPTGGATLAYSANSATGSDAALACSYEEVPDQTVASGTSTFTSTNDPGGTTTTTRRWVTATIALRPAATEDHSMDWWPLFAHG